jgi:hypothetical protein
MMTVSSGSVTIQTVISRAVAEVCAARPERNFEAERQRATYANDASNEEAATDEQRAIHSYSIAVKFGQPAAENGAAGIFRRHQPAIAQQ